MEEDTLYQKVTLPYTDAAPKAGETPFFLVLLLLIFLPPAAWYVMAKEKAYHSWFAFLIAFYSLLAIFGSLLIRLIFQPQVTRLYQSLHISEPSVTPFAYLNIYIFLGIIELAAAVVIFFIRKKYKDLPKMWLIISMAILACNSVLQPLSLLYFTYVSLHSVYQQNRVVSTTYTTSPAPTVLPTDTSWKEYKNDSFRLEYPSNLFALPYSLKQLSQESNTPDITGNFKKDMNTSLTPPEVLTSAEVLSEDIHIYFWLFTNNQRESVESWFGKYGYYPESISSQFSDDEKPYAAVKIGSLLGKEGYPKGMVANEAILVPYKNTMLFIYSSNYNGSETNKTLIHNILSTFSFLDEVVSPTCRPRPSCLDATPRCLIAETADMCPAPTK